MKVKMLAVAAGIAMMASSASAAIVENGSFETNSGYNGGNNWGTYPSIPGWMAAENDMIEIQNQGTLGRAAADGDWYVELDSTKNSTMFQDVTFDSVGQYVLSFFYAPRTADLGDNGISYSLSGLTSVMTVDDVLPSGWREVRTIFDIATAGLTSRLTFTASGTSNSLGGFIDNVSIAPVPVPAAGLMLMGGLAGLGAIARRRRQA